MKSKLRQTKQKLYVSNFSLLYIGSLKIPSFSRRYLFFLKNVLLCSGFWLELSKVFASSLQNKQNRGFSTVEVMSFLSLQIIFRRLPSGDKLIFLLLLYSLQHLFNQRLLYYLYDRAKLSNTSTVYLSSETPFFTHLWESNGRDVRWFFAVSILLLYLSASSFFILRLRSKSRLLSNEKYQVACSSSNYVPLEDSSSLLGTSLI